MREALAIVGQEGLQAMWERHARVQQHLWDGLSSMGLEPFVENKDERLITVNTIKVPLSMYRMHAGAWLCINCSA